MIGNTPTEIEGEAQFNIGLATAIEIRKLLNECNTFSRIGDFPSWYTTLLVIKREIKSEKKYTQCETKINDALKKASETLQSFEKNKTILRQTQAFQKLNDLEDELRSAIKICGLGMPEKDDDEGL